MWDYEYTFALWYSDVYMSSCRAWCIEYIRKPLPFWPLNKCHPAVINTHKTLLLLQHIVLPLSKEHLSNVATISEIVEALIFLVNTVAILLEVDYIQTSHLTSWIAV